MLSGFTYNVFVNIGKNPGNKVLSAVELTPGILRAAMQVIIKKLIEEKYSSQKVAQDMVELYKKVCL